MEQNKHNFTEGGIFQPLLRFALPVLFAFFLQAMYGAVDLMIVGRFTEDVFVSAHVSAVSTGSQIMMTLTNLVASFAMGATVLLGQQIGEGRPEKGGETIGAALATVFAQAVSVIVSLLRMRRKKLPFTLTRSDVRLQPQIARRITKLGLPIALQDFLVGVSFLLIQVIVNSLGVLASAGVGVAEKVCAFAAFNINLG